MRARRLAVVALAVAGMAGPLLAPAAATADRYDFAVHGYRFTIDGAAASYLIENPRPLPHDVGVARVDLTHRAGQSQGRCVATGAGYLLAPDVEDGYVLDIQDQRRDPADASSGGGYYNPTVARAVAPDTDRNPRLGSATPAVHSPARSGEKLADVPAGSPAPLSWAATCRDERSGSATGADLRAPGIEAAAGHAVAAVDETTGRYTATARGHAANLRTGAGTVESITSLVQVTAAPGAEPLVSYRLSLFGIDSADGRSSFDARDGLVLAGTDVPAGQLVEQFNAQVRQAADAVSMLGPAGLALLAPAVHGGGGEWSIVAPAVRANLGLVALREDIGQNVEARLVATSLTIRSTDTLSLH